MDKQKAKEMFMQTFSCSQSTACAFCKECGMTEDQLKKAAIAFGGGFVHNHSLCGALTGAGLVAGIVTGGTEPSSKLVFAEAFQKVVEEFKAKHGSIICSELLADKQMLHDTADLSFATEAEYAARPCLALVLTAVDLADKFIKENK